MDDLMGIRLRHKSGRKRKCLIFGCGGHGRVVLDILVNTGAWDVVGFVDSNRELTGRRVDGVRVLGEPGDLGRIRDELDTNAAIVAVGNNGDRRALADRLDALGFELINAIHPSANLARNVSLGSNTVIAAGALVCAHCQIGDSAILNTGSIVDHESLIGTATHICPGARLAGRVTVESGAFVGIGATVIQHIRVGYEAVVGAGAVVTHDVAPMSTVVGVPAREIKRGADSLETRSLLIPELSASRQPAPT
jgi:acetyltransferase EpsM